jgi:rhodanese-related sulfurtransferase
VEIIRLDPAPFAQHFQENTHPKVLLDIRNPDETALGVIKGAKLIPMPELTTQASSLPKNAWIYVYCRSGNRVQLSLEQFEKQGFRHVVAAINGGYEHLKSIL